MDKSNPKSASSNWLVSDTPVKIAVVGDLILDEYLDGSVNRISPEAPVPIHRVRDKTETAGGAANVARNVQLSGGNTYLLGVLGNDDAGQSLCRIIEKDGIDFSLTITSNDRPTIRKTRITANHQQLVRIDWEQIEPISSELQEQLFEKIQQCNADVILVSDYGKGCLTNHFLRKLIEYGKSTGKKVVVDPKGKDYSGYFGADLITPNRTEACEALGIDSAQNPDPIFLAQRLRDQFGIRNVLVTLGEQGMVGLEEHAKPEQAIVLPALTREVFDVSGAGDTVIALMTLAWGSGSSLSDAMHIANVGAGIVVEKWGTQPITAHELKRALKIDQPASLKAGSSEAKIVAREEIPGLIGEKAQRRRRIVFTNGCFDILHAGHVSYLEEAKKRGDLLVVGVNSDESVARIKGPERPIIPCDQRMKLLAGLAAVDYVFSFPEDSSEKSIQWVSPDVLVKGADYSINEIVGADHVLGSGGIVERIKFVEGLSTTEIIEKVRGANQRSTPPLQS